MNLGTLQTVLSFLTAVTESPSSFYKPVSFIDQCDMHQSGHQNQLHSVTCVHVQTCGHSVRLNSHYMTFDLNWCTHTP